VSLDHCILCSAPADTDLDTDCYITTGHEGKCVCERCREAGDLLVGDDAFLDDPFHGAAWAAFADLYRELGGPPDSEATRMRAYRYYEEELDRKNRTREPAVDETASRRTLRAAR